MMTVSTGREHRLKRAREIAGLGFWEWDIPGDKLHWTDEVFELLGVPPGSFQPTYDAYLARVHEEDRVGISVDIDRAFCNREPYLNEHRILRPDGSILYVRAQGEATHDEEGRPQHLVGTLIDITEQREREEMISTSRAKLRNLADRLNQAREDERRHVANEVHNELGQSLTAIKMDVECIARLIREPELEERFKRLCTLVDDTIDKTRKITFELRPVVLEELGLEAALESELKIFSQRSGCTYNLKQQFSNMDINKNAALVIYKILQESLTNIIRHAAANHVDVSIYHNRDVMTFSIRDDGIGIPEDKIGSINSLGLIGMYERAGSIGGRVIVMPNRERPGTTVCLEIPGRY